MSYDIDDPLGPVDGERAPSTPIAWPLMTIVACTAAMGWLIFSGPPGPVRSGVADVQPERTGDQGSTVRMAVRNSMIDGVVQTPSWEDLARTYRLREPEVRGLMETYGLQRPPGSPPLRREDPIQEGTEVALTVE